MSNILKFARPDSDFDPDTLAVLADVYDRACSRFCCHPAGQVCDEMADRIFAAAMNSERRDYPKAASVGGLFHYKPSGRF